MSSLDPIPYSDAQLRAILQRVKTIAMVGASSSWNRPSYFVMKYLQGKGYRVIPVNPGIAGQTLLGERVYASLRDIPEPADRPRIRRRPDPRPRRGAVRIAPNSGLPRLPRCPSRSGRE
jgi:O-acetylhomoserine (thiol)-lyase